MSDMLQKFLDLRPVEGERLIDKQDFIEQMTARLGAYDKSQRMLNNHKSELLTLMEYITNQTGDDVKIPANFLVKEKTMKNNEKPQCTTKPSLIDLINDDIAPEGSMVSIKPKILVGYLHLLSADIKLAIAQVHYSNRCADLEDEFHTSKPLGYPPMVSFHNQANRYVGEQTRPSRGSVWETLTMSVTRNHLEHSKLTHRMADIYPREQNFNQLIEILAGLEQEINQALDLIQNDLASVSGFTQNLPSEIREHFRVLFALSNTNPYQ